MTEKSKFSTYLIKHNNLNNIGFKQWIFFSGMLFQNFSKWWRSGINRINFHEGIDFCFFEDKSGKYHSLNKDIVVPVMYNGEIVYVCEDFLGKSIFVKHRSYKKRGKILYSIYAHTNQTLRIGLPNTVNEGDKIATIADIKKKNSKISAHLHISTIWLPDKFPVEMLNWKALSKFESSSFCDPLSFIDCKYSSYEDSNRTW